MLSLIKKLIINAIKEAENQPQSDTENKFITYKYIKLSKDTL